MTWILIFSQLVTFALASDKDQSRLHFSMIVPRGKAVEFKIKPDTGAVSYTASENCPDDEESGETCEQESDVHPAPSGTYEIRIVSSRSFSYKIKIQAHSESGSLQAPSWLEGQIETHRHMSRKFRFDSSGHAKILPLL